ncbi:hypothetical protein U9M48_022082 [Paspalum notatum var. saurae]|uniref:GAG-pre-integrase domain-containing protein n=1 Tax=Paspalum notatum var. saurae TaxID=547442 RepID=A0AAQ3TM69_PASNO
MTGSRGAFSELDTSITGTVKFGDNSLVDIAGQGTILFSCSNGSHRALTGVYYIPRLRSNIVSLGQLDECECKVLIDDGVLRIRDRQQKLLAKLTIPRPMCLAARREEAAWRWHARLGHLSFDALGRMACKGMVRGLPAIEHVSELCDSCLAGKQRRALFPKTVNYRAQDPLELVHDDLCGPNQAGHARWQEVLPPACG